VADYCHAVRLVCAGRIGRNWHYSGGSPRGGLDGPLPSIPVPLLPEGADASLDLQTAFANIHDFFRYDQLVNYAGPLPGPLTAEQAEWVEGRLRAAGRR